MNLIYTTGAGEANYSASSEVCEFLLFKKEKKELVLCE